MALGLIWLAFHDALRIHKLNRVTTREVALALAHRPDIARCMSATLMMSPMREYHVAPGGSDSDSGSPSAPWVTIQHAADVATPGSVVHVAPGAYGPVSSGVNGRAGARIRFISDVKWGARLEGSGRTHDVNTISADPRLTNYQPDGTGDYHLRPESPAVYSGTTQGLPSIDFDGAPTSCDVRQHIGPYVFGSRGLHWPWM
jgi:hypothetical protein